MAFFLALLYLAVAFLGTQTVFGPLRLYHIEELLLILVISFSLPALQKTFVQKTVQSLALAGLSMGSGITVNVAVKRTDVFGSLGIMSAGIFTPSRTSPGGIKIFDQVNAKFLADSTVANKQIHLLFFSCGTEDPRLPALKQVWADLKARNINFVAKTYPGEHEWKVWRHSLADMAPLLFR